VLNISEYGLGLDPQEMGRPPEIGEVLEARLMVSHTNALVKLRFVHFSPDAAGFEFIEASDILRAAIHTYFGSELLGGRLERQGKDTTPIVFADTDGNSVRYELTGAALKSFELRLLGMVVSWERGGEPVLHQSGRKDLLPDFQRKQLLAVIRGATHIDDAVRDALEAALYGLASKG
jgi:hypothetical protein